MPSARRTGTAALAVALAAFALYHSTLLPGFDFGDTPSFQVMAGEKAISPRDAYPLYFAIGDLFAWLDGDRARGLNLASAAEGAAAAAVIVLVATELSGSLIAAVATALLFAGSYTFWSQSVIAEVYALHIGLVAVTLWLLFRWERAPTTLNLTCFFAAYALSFGNHLSMILMLPAFTAFLFEAAPGGWRSMLAPRVVMLACALAALGSLQYFWNLRTLWLQPLPPRTITEALSAFWFDVTKSDWRETMMGAVPPQLAGDRLRMYLFDLRQQFGLPALLVCSAGVVALFRKSPKRMRLLTLAFAVNVLFALTYNVGDSHVFFLPSHLMLALFFASGLAALSPLLRLHPDLLPVAGVLLAVFRIYQDYPALDRSADDRPMRLLTGVTEGLDDQRAVLLTDFNWQVENGFTYFTRAVRRDVAFGRALDVLSYAPAIVRDNQAIGRDVFLTEPARTRIAAVPGATVPVTLDPATSGETLADMTRRLAPGTRYVLTILKPTRELAVDEGDLQAAVRGLANRYALNRERDDYVVLAGLAGSDPALVESSSRPFSTATTLAGLNVTIRMDSWLEFDTIRRMGFGHVIAGRHHSLIVERGVSFVALDDHGKPISVAYRANIFEPPRRYLVSKLSAQ
jgi:hypothetical protein